MALEENSNGNGFFMPVAPAYYGGGNNGNNNGFGGDWAWIILLLLLGWGNNGNGFGGNGGGFGGGSGLYPWMNQANLTSEGFQNQLMNDNITSIRDGVNSLSTQLCNCCGDMQMALATGFAGVEQGANTRQIANMQQAFASQMATSQGFNSVQSQLAQCCCDNRLATNDLKYTIATEACNSRATSTANTQAILDKLCQLELDNYKAQLEAKNDTIAQLRSDVLYARGQASQDVQTARILAGQTAEVDALYDRLNNCPVGTVPVYGRQPIFTCNNNNNGCGCGCGGF
ncbi:MAG: hypothetical protein J6Y89_11130 [Lachnospiraceae bacterium]|nr:hypothetical protein [Lachnospiraceae bacterium]